MYLLYHIVARVM